MIGPWAGPRAEGVRAGRGGALGRGHPRWFIVYENYAARHLPAYGVFKEAATANALAVLHVGIARHGRPASIMTDHGSQFFANEAEGRRHGQAAFEADLERPGIRHVAARVRHPQTNGKIERVRKEIERHLPPSRQSRP